MGAIISEHLGFGWLLLIFGLILAGIGLVWLLGPSIPWVGRLPGDFRIETENTRFYFPLATCLLLSLLLGQPAWYPWAIGVLGIAGVLIGGVVRLFTTQNSSP